jgi:hypothetical protein
MADVCISAVADRHALHSIYYSAMKKTAFDLTKRVSTRCAMHCNIVNVAHVQHDNRARRMRGALSNANFRNLKKHDETRTFCNEMISSLSPCHKNFLRARVRFCIDIARSADICTD